MTDTPDQVEHLGTETLYQGFVRLSRHRLRHQSYHGGWCTEVVRERLEGLNAVSVLLYDPQRDQVVMVEQFRIGAMDGTRRPWVLETVGGYRPPDEDPADVARREAQEEANCTLLALRPIGEFLVSPGVSTETISLFCGRVDASLAGGVHGLAEEGEETRVVVLSADEAIGAMFGRVNSTSAIITLQWLAAQRPALRADWT